MIGYCVDVFVVEGKEDIFIAASNKNRNGTRKEKGNLRFDILQQDGDLSRFMLFEVYTSEEAVKAHKETAHYLEWRETVAPLMARKREGIRYRQVSDFE